MTLAALAACDRGGDDDGDGGGSTPTLAVTGNAATGGAIVGGTVEAKCATGTGSATTAADGGYSLSMPNGRLPCLLRVTSGATVLHSVVAGSGNSAVANITPATQLMVARVTAAEPTAAYAAFDGATAVAVTSTAVSNAQAAVVATLRPAGVDFSTIADLIGGTFRPRVGATAGDAYDVLLDALAARLNTIGLTLPALTSAIATEAANLGNTTPASSTPSLPPGALLQAAASNCSALRSGTYRVFNPNNSGVLAEQFGTISLNATTLISRDGGANTDNPVWVPNGNCRYLTDNDTTDLTVSQAGVLVVRTSMGGNPTRVLAWAMPEQTHTLDELTGTWNLLGMSRNLGSTNTYSAEAVTLTLSAAGAISNVTVCQNATTWSLKGSDCVLETTGLPTLRVNAAGGFDIVEPNNTVSGRLFAYRSGTGELMAVSIDDRGSFEFWTRQRLNALPAVGLTTSSWNLYAGALLTSPQAVDVTTTVITSGDAATGAFTRTLSTAPNTTVTRPESLFVNNPRNGYNFRVGAQVVNSAGATVTVNEFTALQLRGMGLTAVVLPTPKLFLLAVNQ